MRPSDDPMGHQRHTALLLSPDAWRLSRLGQLLEEERLLTIAVLDVRSALRCLDDEEVDVIVVDLGVDEPAGALLRAASARSPAPIVAFGDPPADPEALRLAGAAAHVPLGDGLRPVAWEARRVARQGRPEPTGPLVDGELLIDADAGEAWYGEHRLELTPVQLRLLAILAAADGAVVRNEELHRALFGDGGYRGERLASQVLRLRTQLARAGLPHDRVSWVAGVGYRLTRG